MSIPVVVGFDRLTEDLAAAVGGKCASLGTMSQAGLPVPPGFAITTTVFTAAKRASGTREDLIDLIAGIDLTDSASLAVGAAKAREIVRTWPIPEATEARIRAKYAALGARCGVEDLPVAVRSSATAEDSPDASFAGEHDTYLWVRGADAVMEKLKACWASLYTDRAIAYRDEMGYHHDEVDMSVAVQKMVHPRAAGVAFTLDPSNGDRSGISIDAAWGFGEGVVSGDITPDNFLVDKVMWHINKRTISPKAHAYRLTQSDSGGDRVERVELDEQVANAPCLTDEEIVAIARLARTAEKHYGCPQDIEWAVDQDLPGGEDVVLLQARPETVWSKKTSQISSGADQMTSIVHTLVNPLYSRRKS
ncbi:MAG: PEP/pyruvate-binding domain-containing protein [Nocardioides sp.]